MEPVEIREDNLLLRPWRATDADDVYRACQDPAILRWTPLPAPYPREHAVTFVTERSPAGWSAGTAANLAVVDPLTGELLGSTGLVRLDVPGRTGELGYWVAPWARGRNIAERAGRAVARWAFSRLNLARISWRAEPGNHASRLIAWRLGFQFEGTLRGDFAEPDGRRTDTWLAALLPGELTSSAAESSAPPGSVRARQAATFMAAPPVLTAKAAAGHEIRLRAPAERDIDGLMAACRDPESIRWTTVPDPYQRSHGESFVRRHAPGHLTEGTGAVFAVADDNDAVAGTIALRLSPTDPQVADVGYLMAPWARGRGYAPAALRALADWGFPAFGLSRIEWRAHVGNTASRRAAEKAGFTVEGVARCALAHRGDRRDVWVGALLPDDPGGRP